MKATEWEFRYRALTICLVYCVGFWLYAVDHVPLIAVLVRSLSHRYAIPPVLAAKLVTGFAALLVALGALVRTWGAAYLRSSVVHDAKLHAAELVADGPYRHLRHPLYSASILTAFGFALLASRSGFFFIVIVMTLLVVRLAGREETELEREIGERYREYSRRVPRLWPSLAPRVPATGAKPRWGQAFRGEMFMWGFAVAIGAFAATQRWPVLWSVLTLAYLSFLGQQYVHNRRRKKPTEAAA